MYLRIHIFLLKLQRQNLQNRQLQTKRLPSPAKSRKQKNFDTDYRNIAASKESNDSYLDTSDDESIEVSNRKTEEEDLKDPEVIEEVTLSEGEDYSDEGSDLDNLAEELTRL